MRTIILSDVHAQPHLITNALDHAQYDRAQDSLIFCGDVLDIGDSPHECLDILTRERAQLLYGNHELAIMFRKYVHPQNIESWDLSDRLSRMRLREFKVATHVDDILVTHAGLTVRYCNFVGLDAENMTACEIAQWLNTQPGLNGIDDGVTEDLWQDYSPVWARPYMDLVPGLRQVVGHTPPGYARKYCSDEQLRNVWLTDPYTDVGFDRNRFRYVIVQDGKVGIYDSNH